MVHRLRALLIDRLRHLHVPAFTAFGRPARQKYATLLAIALLFAQFVLMAQYLGNSISNSISE